MTEIVIARWVMTGKGAVVKELVFYSIAAGVIGLIAQVAGASLPIILFLSLLIPPLLLLIIRIIR